MGLQNISFVSSPKGKSVEFRDSEEDAHGMIYLRLFLDGKEQVVLNVGYNNTAKRVYDRIGFIGLSGQDKPDSVEDVLELGFIGTERGYW